MKRFFTVLIAAAILSPLPVSSAVVGDVDGDGKIDLSEAIYALQVSAGAYPGVSTSCQLAGKGTWQAATPYIECDVIKESDTFYICTANHTSSLNFSTDSVNWTALAWQDASSPCTEPDEVLSQNQCWKDRNLGASQVANSWTDPNAYGDLYQWGRPADGHQNRTSQETTMNSSNDVPGHRDFITEPETPYDWRIPQNNNLWQGLGGVNNPCPQGFRLPTVTELATERASWGSTSGNAEDAYLSPLKLTKAGDRRYDDGELELYTQKGFYWSSTVSGTWVRYLVYDDNVSGLYSAYRGWGMSVRCIKD